LYNISVFKAVLSLIVVSSGSIAYYCTCTLRAELLAAVWLAGFCCTADGKLALFGLSKVLEEACLLSSFLPSSWLMLVGATKQQASL
jgi:hypothetical protein